MHRLQRQKSAILDLPTGAGKTNVALITAAGLLLQSKTGVDYPAERKAFFIVPTRVLISQVVKAATWISPEIRRVGLDDSLAHNRIRLRAAYDDSHLIVSTPGLLAGLLSAGSLGPNWKSDISFVIVDEFDEFLIDEATPRGFDVRFDVSFEKLYSHIQDKPTLLMSGTNPTNPGAFVSPSSRRLAAFMENTYAPSQVTTDADSYRSVIPLARINPVPIRDEFVREAVAALRLSFARATRRFDCEHYPLDWDYVIQRIPMILRSGGGSRTLRGGSGKGLKITDELIDVCKQLQSIINRFTFLSEDMFAGIEVSYEELFMYNDECKTMKLDGAVLVDKRTNVEEFHPFLRSKATTVSNIVKRRKRERGVIMTRYTRLSDRLKEHLEGEGVTVFLLDGRIEERYRLPIVTSFSSTDGAVLILTRNTGRRGLDLPLADYAIFYSPKDDEFTMWQELSRIRSTLSKKKDSYLLYYIGTSEENKLATLVDALSKSQHNWEIIGPKRSSTMSAKSNKS
jgi:superfamily II DNA/RNA helicase